MGKDKLIALRPEVYVTAEEYEALKKWVNEQIKVAETGVEKPDHNVMQLALRALHYGEYRYNDILQERL